MYLTVRQDGDSNEHIGTIKAENSEELNKKLTIALMEHYDVEVKFEPLDIEDYKFGGNGTTTVHCDNTNDDYQYTDTFFITETWLY